MGKIILLFLFSLFLFASNIKDANKTKNLAKYKITKKMKIYEQEKKKKEAEANTIPN